LLGHFLFVQIFAHKFFVTIHLFFDFVETHIGWFLALKHILKGHAGLWSGLGDFDVVFWSYLA
jgi:hypothetical protein